VGPRCVENTVVTTLHVACWRPAEIAGFLNDKACEMHGVNSFLQRLLSEHMPRGSTGLAALLFTACHAMSPSTQPTAVRVAGWLRAHSDATTLPRAALAPAVRYTGPVGERIRGAIDYCSAAARWERDCGDLFLGYTTAVTRCATLGSPMQVVRKPH